jgi:hypothetical protein
MITVKLKKERRGAVCFIEALIEGEDFQHRVNGPISNPGFDSSMAVEFMYRCVCDTVNLVIYTKLWERENDMKLPDFYVREPRESGHVMAIRPDFDVVAKEYNSFMDFQSNTELEIELTTFDAIPIVATEFGLRFAKV